MFVFTENFKLYGCLSLEILPRREKHSLACYLLSFLSSSTSQWPSSLHHSIITLTVSKQGFIHSFSSPTLFCTFLQEIKTTLSSQSQSQIIVKNPKHMQSTAIQVLSLTSCISMKFHFTVECGNFGFNLFQDMILYSVPFIFCSQWTWYSLISEETLNYTRMVQSSPYRSAMPSPQRASQNIMMARMKI